MVRTGSVVHGTAIHARLRHNRTRVICGYSQRFCSFCAHSVPYALLVLHNAVSLASPRLRVTHVRWIRESSTILSVHAPTWAFLVAAALAGWTTLTPRAVCLGFFAGVTFVLLAVDGSAWGFLKHGRYVPDGGPVSCYLYRLR